MADTVFEGPHGGVALAGSAAVVRHVVSAVCNDTVREYFLHASKTAEQAEAGIAIFNDASQNMESYNHLKSKHAFRFSPEAFAFALGVFASMSKKAHVVSSLSLSSAFAAGAGAGCAGTGAVAGASYLPSTTTTTTTLP